MTWNFCIYKRVQNKGQFNLKSNLSFDLAHDAVILVSSSVSKLLAVDVCFS